MRAPRRGATALEYALVLPILLVLVFGVIDWSWYLFEWMTLTRAAGQGLRLSVGVPLSEDPIGIAEDETARWLRTGLAGGDAVADIRATLDPEPEGTVLTVSVTAPFDAPIDLVWTPAELRASAQGNWYGDVFGE